MQFKDLMVTRYRIEREGEKLIRLTIDGAARTITDQEPMEDELVTFPGK